MKVYYLVIHFAVLLIIAACQGNNEITEYPEKLDVSALHDVRIRQRETIQIKGTAGDLSLYLGDITHGACLIEITGRQKGKEYIYLNRSLSEHDSTTFAYHDRYYRVIINGFELHLLHDDFAFLTIREVTKDEAKKDARGISAKQPAEEPFDPEKAMEYIQQIDESKCTFIRDGYAKNGHDFASFLLTKMAMNKRDVRTKADFRNKILARSNETGEPYKVVTEKGDTVLLNEWIKW